MSLFSATSLLIAAAFFSLGNYVYFKDRKNPLNRTFAAFSLVLAFLSISEYGYTQAGSAETAYFWIKMSFFWPLAVSLFLHFILVFTGKIKKYPAKVTYSLVYIPAVILSLFDLTTNLLTEKPVRTEWGWKYTVPEDQSVVFMAFGWIAVVVFFSLLISLRHFLKARGERKKRQAKYILIGFTVPVVAGAIFDGVLAASGSNFPDTERFALLLGAVFIVYTIFKHELFSLTAESAAQNIISIMSDYLFLVGSDGKMLKVNDAALALLGYDESSLVGKPFEFLFPEGDQHAVFQNSILPVLDRMGNISNLEVTLKTKDDRVVPITLSGFISRDRAGGIGSIVFIGRSSVEHEQAEDELRDAEEMLTFVQKAARIGNWDWDIRTGKIRWTDEVFRIFGLRKQEHNLTPDNYLEMVHPDDRNKAHLSDLGEKVRNIKYRIVRPDGEIRTIHERSETEFDRSGNPIRSIGTFQDITEQKAAEQILKESEARFRSLSASTSVGIYLIDTEGNCIYANDSLLNIFELKLDECLGIGWRRRVHPDDIERLSEEISLAQLENKDFKGEYRILLPDGTVRWVSTRSSAMMGDDGLVLGRAGTLMDITGRKRAEEELSASERKYRNLVETSRSLIFQCDMEGRLTFLSKAWVESYGYRVEEMLGKKFSDFQPLKISMRDTDVFSGFRNGEALDEYETEFLSKSGNTLHLIVNARPLHTTDGEIFGLQGTAFDITERKLAEEKIKSSEERFRTIFNNVHDMIVYVDKLGRIINVNKAVENILGYKPEDVKGRNFAKIGVVSLKEIPRMLKLFKDAVLNGNVLDLVELEVRHKDGRMVPIEVSTKLIRENGKITGAVNILRDVSERKEAEAAIWESEKRFRDLFEESSDAIFVEDLNGNVLDANPSADRLHGVKRGELIGKNVLDLVPTERRNVVALDFQKLTEGRIDLIESYSMNANGDEIPVEISATRLEYSGVKALLLHVRDITERMLAEERVSELEKYGQTE